MQWPLVKEGDIFVLKRCSPGMTGSDSFERYLSSQLLIVPLTPRIMIPTGNSFIFEMQAILGLAMDKASRWVRIIPHPEPLENSNRMRNKSAVVAPVSPNNLLVEVHIAC